MKKKTIVLIVVVILALGAGLVLVSCGGSGISSSGSSSGGSSTASSNSSSSDEVKLAPPPTGVKDITTGKQESGGVTFTNYRINTTDEINWDTMSKEEKQKIVNYAFTETAKLIQRDGIRYYNIIAINPSGNALFMLDRETDEIVTYKDGQPEYRFSAP